MKRRPLGDTGIEVAPLAFGGNVFGWTVDEPTAFLLLDAFVDHGFNLVDTADVYSKWAPGNSGGESETVIGRWIERSGKRDRVVIALNGYRDNGIQVIQTSTGRVLQTVPLAAGFIGLAFDPAGRSLFVSGGNRDVIYRLAWSNGTATLTDSIILEPRTARQDGKRYPAGLAVSRDGRWLYVAENLTDSLAVIDVASGRVVQRVGAGRYPYGVVTGPDGQVYVSAWGSFEVRSWRPAGDSLESVRAIRVGRHPSAMLFNADGSRLFIASASTDRIAVVDPKLGAVIAEVVDTVPGSSGEGSTPNGMALTPDGHRLYIAEDDNNAVGVFDLSAM